jgi:hypothetical protein
VSGSELEAAKSAVAAHRGPSYRTTKTEEGADGRRYPISWNAVCRCGVVTDDYETHFLEVIVDAVLIAHKEGSG